MMGNSPLIASFWILRLKPLPIQLAIDSSAIWVYACLTKKEEGIMSENMDPKPDLVELREISQKLGLILEELQRISDCVTGKRINVHDVGTVF
jgi:hypothetical protein